MPVIIIFRTVVFLCILTLISCTKSEMTAPSLEEELSYNNVEANLQNYFQRFEQEGASRGWNIDLETAEIIGEIKEIDQEYVAGQCSWASHEPNIVTIDLSFWNSATDLSKEFVVFHELGHCYLNRDHREDANTNGQCISLMRSGLGDCVDNYNTSTRNTYLDELFNRTFAQL